MSLELTATLTMELLMSLSIRNKLLSAFSLLLVLMTGRTINNARQLNSTTIIPQRIMGLRLPGVFNGQVLINSTEFHNVAQQLDKSRETSLAVGRTNDLTSNMGQMISQFQVL